MAQMTMELMLQKAAKIQKLMAIAAQETDPEKSKALADELLAEGHELEKMGKQMQEEAGKARGRPATLEIVLTADQRKRVFQKTGIALETLIIEDEAGAMNQSMPQARPEYIESLAMKEAERRKNAAEADRLVRAELERAMAEIDSVGNAELSEQLRQLQQDPSFAGGMLQKK